MTTLSKKHGPTSKFVYVIEGSPIPLARIRISKTSFRIYDSQKELKLITQINLQNQHGDRRYYQGPLHVDATFYFKIPKTRVKNLHEDDWMVSKPDTDNLLKFLLDIGNHILWHDDATVVSISTRKRYSKDPRTEFTITEIKTLEDPSGSEAKNHQKYDQEQEEG